MKIHVEIYLAAQMLQREQGKFSTGDVVQRVKHEFGDTRPGVQTHATSHCVANKPLHTTYINNYLWHLDHGQYRCFDPLHDTPHPTRIGGRYRPDVEEIPPTYRWLLQPDTQPIGSAPTGDFEPAGKTFHFGMAVDEEPDPHLAHIAAPYVRWGEIWDRLKDRA